MPAYDILAPVWDEFSVLFAPIAFERLSKLAPFTSFVDFGCGTGQLLAMVAEKHPEARLEGVDASRGMLDLARARKLRNVTWTHGPMRSGAQGTYDVAGCFHDSLNHMLTSDALTVSLRGVARSLRPGGRKSVV